MSADLADLALAAQCHRVARFCARLVGAAGALLLVAIGLGLPGAEALLPSLVVEGDTALAVVAMGAALATALAGRSDPRWRAVQYALAGAIGVLGLVTLGQYIPLTEPLVERLVASTGRAPAQPTPDGPFAMALGAAFLCTGLALALIDRIQSTAIVQGSTLVGLALGTFLLMDRLYTLVGAYGVSHEAGIAAPVAAAICLADLGILAAQPGRGVMATLASATSGGLMARRLMPLAFAAPLAVGWLRMEGAQHELFPPGLDVAVVTMTYMALFALLVWHTAGVLRRHDARRYAAERAQREQQAQLNGIIESAMDAILMVDASQRIVLFNRAAEQMFRLDAGDIIGEPLERLLPPRFHGTHSAGLNAYGAPPGGGRHPSGRLTVTGLRADGEEFPIDASVSRLAVGDAVYYTAILRDVSENRRTQEALRASEARERARSAELTTLLDAVPAMVFWAHDPAAHVITGNRLAQEWLGVSESTMSKSAPQREHLAHLRLLKDGVEVPPDALPVQIAARGTEVRDYELDIAYCDGTTRRILGNATPLLDESGEPRGAVSAFVDITARRDAQLALEAAKAQAEQANNAKSRFLAAASHDLRQPLSALGLYVKLLKAHVAPSGTHLLGNLDDCIVSLSELLTDLLDLSKLEAGVIKPNLADFPVSDVLGSLASVHASEAQLKGLRLRCAPTRLYARTDPVLFKRIVGNLIDNAIRYTERGGVLVGCRRRGGRTWVEVWDSGVGIPPDKTGEIFEEFTQLGDEARNRGSGLGLAIVARTAALLGLRIDVRSRPGRGSVFAVELPPGEAHVEPVVQGETGAYRSLRIALVEDNRLVREALAAALAATGHAVVASADGAGLLALLGGTTPDIVVSDYRLGEGKTGFDVITTLRGATTPNLPAILVTGDTDPRLVRSMADRGIVVLHKPLDLETLQAYLEDLVSQAEAEAV